MAIGRSSTYLPKEIDGLPRFVRKQRQGAEHLLGERFSEETVESISERPRKAETLADEIAAKLKKPQDIKEQGKVKAKKA